MEIKVYGPGCTRCTETEKLVKEVAATKKFNINVQKISDLKEIVAAGIMATPALSINGVVKSTGRIPTKEEISEWIDGVKGINETSNTGASLNPAASGGCPCGGNC